MNCNQNINFKNDNMNYKKCEENLIFVKDSLFRDKSKIQCEVLTE